MKRILIILFTLLYCSVGFVSVYHSIEFFEISNNPWLSIILACTFEIGQAAVLFSLLTIPNKKIMPWILMIVLTIVQVIGNIYASYKYMMTNNTDLITYFTDSVLFFVQDPNPKFNQVMISYITGAILPIVALCMTGMVASFLESDNKQKVLEERIEDTTEKIVDDHVENVDDIKKEEEKIIL